MPPFQLVNRSSDPIIEVEDTESIVSGMSNDVNEKLDATENRMHRRKSSSGLRGSVAALKRSSSFKNRFNRRSSGSISGDLDVSTHSAHIKINETWSEFNASTASSLDHESLDSSSNGSSSPKNKTLDLAEVAGTRAEEYLEECFANENSVLKREKVDAISEYVKSDLVIGKHLGKGCFSDVFEVVVTINERKPLTIKSGDDADDLDKLLEKMEKKEQEQRGRSARPAPPARSMSMRPMRSSVCIGAVSAAQMKDLLEDDGGEDDNPGAPDGSATLNRQAPSSRSKEQRLTLAMKCLRPGIRSDPGQFMIGVEDLIHETAMLASLDHKHIVKLHGRSYGDISKCFNSNNGYFILLDRLVDTLDDRIELWKKTSPPMMNQLKVACAISDALNYLHMNNIVFRDLKPANVGFDAKGVLKLFDFGFAAEVSNSDDSDDGLLHDKAGTIRYMAPEVALERGYKFEADVYSFGILLWEICNLKKPFGKVSSPDDFHKLVHVKGTRPKVGKNVPTNIKELMESCWVVDKTDRPTMSFVKSVLTATVRDLGSNGGQNSGPPKRNKMMKRLTWDL